MEPQMILGFVVVSVTLALTPGADWAYSIAAGLGRNRMAPAVAGLCAGYLVHTALIVAGLAALIAARPELLTGLTVLGAGYLLWLGITTARSWRGAGFAATDYDGGGTRDGNRVPDDRDGTFDVAAEAAAARSAARRSFLKGLGISASNPKALLLYLALIPQFVAAGQALPIPVQTGILGLSHFAITVGVYTLVAVGARRLLRSRPGAARGVTLASGIVMMALGLALLAEQLPGLVDDAARVAAAIG
ncbi:LysE family translocator [Arthrobacter sp. KK5.5]|uniref:LysE family translocator n=1 Tax=Arthrobacter sp. KK5.5 TaxID=3373084 RepID=UPI003EE48CCB